MTYFFIFSSSDVRLMEDSSVSDAMNSSMLSSSKKPCKTMKVRVNQTIKNLVSFNSYINTEGVTLVNITELTKKRDAPHPRSLQKKEFGQLPPAYPVFFTDVVQLKAPWMSPYSAKHLEILEEFGPCTAPAPLQSVPHTCR